MTTQAPVITNREEAEAFLDDRIGHGVQPGLERIEGVLGFMGNPHETYPSIHVAGTNGKTTVSRMVQQILGVHGLATGGFTSPHLDTVEERYWVHGRRLTEEEFTQAVGDMAWFVHGYETEADTPVTYFEVTAALAFSVFAEQAVDVAVVEVGLGGRLDATNVLVSDVSVITGIDYDHMEFLGNTLSDIAGEKAAIVKDGGTLVSGPLPAEAEATVAERVESVKARWVRNGSDFSVLDAVVGVGGWQVSVQGVFGEYEDLFLPMHGRHQVDNLATAIATAEMFLGRELDADLLTVAVASMRSPGRLEVVARRPVVLLDGSHNQQGIGGLAATIEGEFPPMSWNLVFALRGERNVAELVAALAGLVAEVHTTRVADPASQDPDVLATELAAALGVAATSHATPKEALDAATAGAGPEGGVVAAGSLYLVGELRHLFDVPEGATQEAHLRFEAERPFDDDDDVPEEEDPDFG
ncbi:MAG: bifunctional folylpolyglutamate synthase/dihydrofolate synthase [Acidimicrobiia bacterium]